MCCGNHVRLTEVTYEAHTKRTALLQRHAQERLSAHQARCADLKIPRAERQAAEAQRQAEEKLRVAEYLQFEDEQRRVFRMAFEEEQQRGRDKRAQAKALKDEKRALKQERKDEARAAKQEMKESRRMAKDIRKGRIAPPSAKFMPVESTSSASSSSSPPEPTQGVWTTAEYPQTAQALPYRTAQGPVKDVAGSHQDPGAVAVHLALGTTTRESPDDPPPPYQA